MEKTPNPSWRVGLAVGSTQAGPDREARRSEATIVLRMQGVSDQKPRIFLGDVRSSTDYPFAFPGDPRRCGNPLYSPTKIPVVGDEVPKFLGQAKNKMSVHGGRSFPRRRFATFRCVLLPKKPDAGGVLQLAVVCVVVCEGIVCGGEAQIESGVVIRRFWAFAVQGEFGVDRADELWLGDREAIDHEHAIVHLGTQNVLVVAQVAYANPPKSLSYAEFRWNPNVFVRCVLLWAKLL